MERRFETFTLLISGINRCIRKIKSQEMAEFNLKSPHVSCLYYLYRADSLTASELCEMCDEDKANISRTVRYLEENGYLICHSASEKRYQCPISLTEKGKMVGRFINERVESVLLDVGKHLSEEERNIMYRTLASVYHDLQEFCSRQENP